MTADLFERVADVLPSREVMAEGAMLLRGFAASGEAGLLVALREIEIQAPFRRMFTPGGHQMSVAMINCGETGWVISNERQAPKSNATGAGGKRLRRHHLAVLCSETRTE